MLSAVVAALLVASTGPAAGEGPPATFAALLAAVQQAPAAEAEAAVERFLAARHGTPIVDGRTVTFLVQGTAERPPRILADFNGWGYRAFDEPDPQAGVMTRLGGSGWFYLRTELAAAARVEYLVREGPQQLGPDPRNPRRAAHGAGASEVVGSAWVESPDVRGPEPSAHGATLAFDVPSRLLGAPRHIVVYTPPGYDSRRAYPAVFFHDGSLVLESGDARRLLDRLIARHRMAAVVAVFVDPLSRGDDYAPGAAFREFFATELLPWVETRFAVARDASRHAVVGLSRSALAALDLAWRRPDLFGRCGLLIPSTEPGGLPAAIAAAPRRDVRFVVVAGLYDRLLLPQARALRQALAARGYALEYREVPEGHQTDTWRGHLGEVLARLFPPS